MIREKREMWIGCLAKVLQAYVCFAKVSHTNPHCTLYSQQLLSLPIPALIANVFNA